jgi:L,D-transpeptidase ErfK/SrfK
VQAQSGTGSWSLTSDRRHVVPTLSSPLLINVAQRVIFLDDGGTLRAYPIGVGTRDWPTPIGAFTVIEKEEEPAWDVPASIQEEMRRDGKPIIARMPPGPRNPLGAHYIRLSFMNLGIHGTIEPASVGRAVSHGCVRMFPDDVRDLYARVEVGLAGVIVYEPVLATVSEGRVFVEVHKDVYRRAPAPLARLKTLLLELPGTPPVDWSLVANAIRRRAGRAEDVTALD